MNKLLVNNNMGITHIKLFERKTSMGKGIGNLVGMNETLPSILLGMNRFINFYIIILFNCTCLG